MPDVSETAILDVVLGLVFLFFVLSIVCSAINEVISSVLRLRARDLQKGLRSLLGDEEAVSRLLEHPRIQALTEPGTRRLPPSYLPPRVVAATVLDTFVPQGEGDRDLIARTSKTVGELQSSTARVMLQDALEDARGDVDALRAGLERSFNEVMDRTSGWYKRRVQWILLALALALCSFGNADTFAVAERLWKDDAVRATVVAKVDESTASTPQSAQSLDAAVSQVEELEVLGIPLGWTDDTTPDQLEDWLGKVLGILMTTFAVSLGAPFWFDLLGKVARLRAAGRREPEVAGREDTTAGSAAQSG